MHALDLTAQNQTLVRRLERHTHIHTRVTNKRQPAIVMMALEDAMRHAEARVNGVGETSSANALAKVFIQVRRTFMLRHQC